MRKLFSTYRNAQRGGDALPTDAKRIHKVAEKLGRKSVARALQENATLDRQNEARFSTALATAQGGNKGVLEVLAAAAKIPYQPASTPLAGREVISPNSTVHEWSTSLRAGVNSDPSRPNTIPQLGDLGTIQLDSSLWSHNGYTLPVRNMHIVSRASKSADGTLGAATSELFINTTEFDPDAPFSEAGFTGGVMISLDESGTISGIGITEGQSTGYRQLDPSQTTINLEALLSSAEQAANQTATAYTQVAANL